MCAMSHLGTEARYPMNGPPAVGAVENESSAFAVEVGLHGKEPDPEHLRAERQRVPADAIASSTIAPAA
jgi:hypothetical protein